MTRAHYEFPTYRLCSLDRARPRKSQLGSIELPKYSHRTVLPLDQQVRHMTVPYSRWSGTMFLPSDHPCLITVHKDGLGPSHDPPTTVSPLHSYDLAEWCKLQITRRPNLPLGEWFAVMCLLSVSSSIYSFMHMGEAVACTTYCLVRCEDDR